MFIRAMPGRGLKLPTPVSITTISLPTCTIQNWMVTMSLFMCSIQWLGAISSRWSVSTLGSICGKRKAGSWVGPAYSRMRVTLMSPIMRDCIMGRDSSLLFLG